MFFQELEVDPRFAIESFQKTPGRELYKILVSLLVPGEERKVVDLSRPFPGFAFFPSRALGQIRFQADDGFDPLGNGFLVELDGAEEGAVIRKGQGGHVHLHSLRHQVTLMDASIQEGKVAVNMQVDEVFCFHFNDLRLPPPWDLYQMVKYKNPDLEAMQ